jgi:hypothetical protein
MRGRGGCAFAIGRLGGIPDKEKELAFSSPRDLQDFFGLML